MNKLVALSQTFPVVNLESPSNEAGILNFYSTYSISMKTLFRPETIYIMISKVFGSFDRYILKKIWLILNVKIVLIK